MIHYTEISVILGVVNMELAKVELSVPKEILPYIKAENADMQLKRNALILHLYISNHTISHGKAAELLGINKLDLIALYGELGFAYFEFEMQEIEDDVQTIRNMKGVS